MLNTFIISIFSYFQNTIAETGIGKLQLHSPIFFQKKVEIFIPYTIIEVYSSSDFILNLILTYIQLQRCTQIFLSGAILWSWLHKMATVVEFGINPHNSSQVTKP